MWMLELFVFESVHKNLVFLRKYMSLNILVTSENKLKKRGGGCSFISLSALLVYPLGPFWMLHICQHLGDPHLY